jgi:anti-sigma factor RsiW
MHGPWIEKISAAIDGSLSESEEQALSDHLAGCAECRRVETELRQVVSLARQARDEEPSRDLWPGIAAAIRETAAAGPPLDAGRLSRLSAVTPSAASRVRPVGAARDIRRRPARRFSLSVPQLAAAAVVLMALSGTVVWTMGERTQAVGIAAGTIIQSASGAPRSVQPVSATTPSVDYAEDVAGLEQALEQNRGQLDPATVEVIERSLEAIDGAIEDARDALAADPGNPYLHRQLDNTMQKKIDVLRRATGAQRAQS